MFDEFPREFHSAFRFDGVGNDEYLCYLIESQYFINVGRSDISRILCSGAAFIYIGAFEVYAGYFGACGVFLVGGDVTHGLFERFLWKRKLYWLIPMILLLIVFAVFIILQSNPVTAPFIYSLF